jgi:histidinol-phosphate aminotransferase
MNNFDFKDYIQSNLSEIIGYQALSYPNELRNFIKLDGNENPYGPSKKAIEVLSQRNDFHLYPDHPDKLRQKIADSLNVLPENIVCSAGADAVINLIFSSFKKQDMKLVIIKPSFGMYKHDAMINNLLFDEINLEIASQPNGHYLDANLFSRNKHAFIFAIPNNPTGGIMEKESILKLLDAEHLVIIDEAYIKFSKHQSYVELTKKYKNLIVIQTFSKWAGLAGLRLGYGVMHRDLSSTLNAIQQPYTITNYAIDAAMVSLDDVEFLDNNVKKIIATKDLFINQLVDITNITPINSEGNFILCRINKGENTDFQKFLYNKNILIRSYSDVELKKYVRISIGTPKNMEYVIEVIKEWNS